MADINVMDDLKLNQTYETCLHSLNLFEREDRDNKRAEVLSKLSTIIKKWVDNVSLLKGIPEHLVQEVSAKLFTFGSYRLGVHDPAADIDILCCLPRHIDRSEFFAHIPPLLSAQAEVTDFLKIEEAYVPVLHMRFDGIEIDLLCSQLSCSIIPNDLDVLDPFLLKSLDEKSVLSLNGCRVTDQILKLVPSVPNFRMALRGIKQWAKVRGIYSNAIGFLGGVSWAILTARICQLNPHALPGTLILKFFRFLNQWKWPTPIILTPIKEEGGPLARKVWNPKFTGAHVMPIITPAYPAMNSTYNVTESTKQILLKEFKRGFEISLKIENGKEPWESLFHESQFFINHNVYIEIECRSPSKEELMKWTGFIESKVRYIVFGIASTEGVKYARPHTNYLKNDNSNYFFIGISFSKRKPGVDKLDLTYPITEFLESVNNWPAKTNSMQISVRWTKASLPTWLFEGGNRPEVKKRKRKVKPTPTPPPIQTQITKTTTTPIIAEEQPRGQIVNGTSPLIPFPIPPVIQSVQLVQPVTTSNTLYNPSSPTLDGFGDSSDFQNQQQQQGLKRSNPFEENRPKKILKA